MDRLAALAAQYLDMQRNRVRIRNRNQSTGQFSEEELGRMDDVLAAPEDGVVRQAQKAFQSHPLFDWVSQYPGLGGMRMIIALNIIGNPWRFPGQRCTEGHYWPMREDSAGRPNLPVGSPCPCRSAPDDDDPGSKGEPCSGTMLAPRPHTGVRSLRHFACLMPGGDGRLMRRVKGQQFHGNLKLKTQFLMPNGIVDQVIKHMTPKYRPVYDATKERKRVEFLSGGVDEKLANGKAHGIARVVVAAEILGDALTEWKRLTA